MTFAGACLVMASLSVVLLPELVISRPAHDSDLGGAEGGLQAGFADTYWGHPDPLEFSKRLPVLKARGALAPPEGLEEQMKRSDGQVIMFKCSRRGEAVCKNGGIGPKVSRVSGGSFMCACKCPYGYLQPRCEKLWWNKN